MTDNPWVDVPESDGEARFIITVRGGTLSDDSRERLVNELKRLADDTNDNQALLIEPEHLLDTHGMTGANIDIQVLDYCPCRYSVACPAHSPRHSE